MEQVMLRRISLIKNVNNLTFETCILIAPWIIFKTGCL